ncbi:hypothetical protein BJ684DRAFT_8099, partial [Piptocephalis cylindrospora]
MALNPRINECKIFVGGLPLQMEREEFASLFEPFGAIADLDIVRHQDSGHSRGFGFVLYRRQDEADEALRKMDNHHISGRTLKVNHAT